MDLAEPHVGHRSESVLMMMNSSHCLFFSKSGRLLQPEAAEAAIGPTRNA